MKYMREKCGAVPAAGFSAHYFVSGNGGATIERPGTKGDYPTISAFPTDQQWEEYAGMASRVADRVAHGNPITNEVNKHGSPKDDDPRKLQSFLMLDVEGPSIKVSHVHLDNLDALYPGQPSDLMVDIDQYLPPVNDGAVELCTTLLFTL
jgi:hypothetical protein